MEPVTQDFVEQTADFMMHLTKKQLDERVDDLKKKQFNIYNMVNVAFGNNKRIEKRDYAFRMALILIRVMEFYEIKLPMISQVTIEEIIKADRKNEKAYDKYPTAEEKFQATIDGIGQPHYFNYLKEVVNSDLVYQSIFNDEDSQHFYFIMIAIGMVYSKTLERYS
jgi:hypothetical protein